MKLWETLAKRWDRQACDPRYSLQALIPTSSAFSGFHPPPPYM
jgi:hypothetical protein